MFLGSAAATFLRPDQLIPSRQGLHGSRIAEGNRQRRREASLNRAEPWSDNGHQGARFFFTHLTPNNGCYSANACLIRIAHSSGVAVLVSISRS